MGIASEINSIKRHYRFKIDRRTKPLLVHTEVVFLDSMWKKVEDIVLSGKKVKWFVLTPVNYDFVKGEFGFSKSKKEYEKILLKKYKWLKDQGQEIQLHVHVRLMLKLFQNNEEIKKEYEKKIKEAAAWMRKNNFKIDKISFGWWAFNDDIKKIAKKLNLEVVNEFDYFATHDYEL